MPHQHSPRLCIPFLNQRTLMTLTLVLFNTMYPLLLSTSVVLLVTTQMLRWMGPKAHLKKALTPTFRWAWMMETIFQKTSWIETSCNLCTVPSQQQHVGLPKTWNGSLTSPGVVRSQCWRAQPVLTSLRHIVSYDSLKLLYDVIQLTFSCLAFMIQCAVHRPDGSNSPFQVSSDISLDDLRYTVGEKLGHFPGQVLLRYRLDSDKAKAGATSIQTDKELNIFKMKMRDLIVPQRLANGKLSTRQRKNILVILEDGNVETTVSAGDKAVRACICIPIILVSLTLSLS